MRQAGTWLVVLFAAMLVFAAAPAHGHSAHGVADGSRRAEVGAAAHAGTRSEITAPLPCPSGDGSCCCRPDRATRTPDGRVLAPPPAATTPAPPRSGSTSLALPDSPVLSRDPHTPVRARAPPPAS